MEGRGDADGLAVIDPPGNATELLRTVFPFSQLDAEAREALTTLVEWLHARAGVRLFSMGDAPNGMYGIVSGRVRFFSEEPQGAVLTADVGPGITFGEVSLLVGGGRSRTAVVWRDALLVRVPSDRFPSLVETLNRCALLGSLQQQSSAAEQADVDLTPDVGTDGFSGFARMREAADVGYRTALAVLASAAELVTLRATGR